jgi:hypothetical protein
VENSVENSLRPGQVKGTMRESNSPNRNSGEEQVMGNRDKRGREKKKPKKKQTKTSSKPAKPATEYKPATPTSQTDEGTGE